MIVAELLLLLFAACYLLLAVSPIFREKENNRCDAFE